MVKKSVVGSSGDAVSHWTAWQGKYSGVQEVSLTAFQAQLLGLGNSDLVEHHGKKLQAPVWAAWRCLQAAAAREGYGLEIASAYRSYERQLGIWNGKLRGERAVVDEEDREIDIASLSLEDCVRCVLRFSALPGASRHHWGTDLDIYDAAAVAKDYPLQLTLAEVAPDGPFGPMHAWLDEQIAAGRSFGFYRPYDKDRQGVAPERWHLSYAPLAMKYQRASAVRLLQFAWSNAAFGQIAGKDVLERQSEALFERFVMRVAQPTQAALEYLPPA